MLACSHSQDSTGREAILDLFYLQFPIWETPAAVGESSAGADVSHPVKLKAVKNG